MSHTTDPLFHAATPRRRGRPPGAKAHVVRSDRRLGVHHFAFVRAGILGVDIRDAFERYVAWSETTSDLRHVEHRQRELMATILDAGQALDASLPDDCKVTRELALLKAKAPAAAKRLPTLDEWLAKEGLDPDMYSEAELIVEYKAALGLDNPDAENEAMNSGQGDLARDRVRALNTLETLLARAPAADDAVSLWFAKPIVAKLGAVGVLTLHNLVDHINIRGFRWYSPIRGFGEQRAGQVAAWLRANAEFLQMEIRAGATKSQSELRRAGSMSLVLGCRFGLGACRA